MSKVTEALGAHFDIISASDEYDRQLFSTSDIVVDDDYLLQIKHNTPGAGHLSLHPNGENSTTMVQKRLCSILRRNVTIKSLFVSGERDNPRSAFWLCVGLQNNRVIDSLEMRDVQLDGMQLHVLGNFIEGNPNLKELYLKGCVLGADDIDILAGALKKNSTSVLARLDLSRNAIGNSTFDKLGQALEVTNCVKRLNLSNNRIGRKGAMSLIELIENERSTLEDLDLSSNLIPAEAMLRLLECLQHNKRLRRLNLQDNLLAEEGWNAVSERALQLVYDTSSVSGIVNSNHTLHSLGNHRGNPRQLTRPRPRMVNPRDLVRDIYIRCLGEERAEYLHASFCINFDKNKSDSFKAGYKILWAHAKGILNVGGDETIDPEEMTHVLAMLGNGDVFANVMQYFREQQEVRGVGLEISRLNAIFRVIQARPEMVSPQRT